MLDNSAIRVREATIRDDSLIAEFFREMWLDLDIPDDAIAPDYLSIVREYIESARRDLDYKAFIAEESGNAIGCVSCQRFAGLYPNILLRHYQRGYIWGVYVIPSHRRRGIATQLTRYCVEYLKSLNCTHAVLNASPIGRSVYENMGFIEGNSMDFVL
ncbi:MAG: GNAT family N-acetyltransferase [Cyanobacteria bacterium P01_E01_bin.42]